MISLKDKLCKAFCDSITVRSVPAGMAVGTNLSGINGDPIGFYVLGDESGSYRLEDSGLTISILEASGVNLESEQRAQVLSSLFEEYDAAWDEDTGELYSVVSGEQNVPSAALRFFALLLRVQDLLITTKERIASTFKEDATLAIREAAGDSIEIIEVVEDYSFGKGLADYPVDLCLRVQNHRPVAVFLCVSDNKVLEALLFQSIAINEVKLECSVVSLLEDQRRVSTKMNRRASNRLDALPIFRGDERAAAERIVKEALNESVRH